MIGLGKSSLDDWIRAIAAAQDRTVVPEPSRTGAPTTAPTTSASRAIGVPAAYIDAGTEVRGQPAGWGHEQQEAWEAPTTTSRRTT